MSLARMAVMKALRRHEVVQFNPDAKKTSLGKAEAEARSVALLPFRQLPVALPWIGVMAALEISKR